MKTFKKYFLWSFIFTIASLIFWFLIWYIDTGTVYMWLSAVFVVFFLWILESSLSFDNMIVNISVLKDMSSLWQKRFITWWIIVAVFGMRLLFPILLVSIFANIDPIQAFKLAIDNPTQYWNILINSHIVIAWFGGAFLMMVWLSFFIDKHKTINWFWWLERVLSKLGDIKWITQTCVLIILILISYFINLADVYKFFVSWLCWVVLYTFIHWIKTCFDGKNCNLSTVAKTWFASFLYLEVLDASFSLDWVIWAFALSSNIFIIAAWLGIGAFFVRSSTIYMLEKWTLSSYRYIQHGAFYAVIALAVMMFVWTIIHLPEVLVWTIWLLFIVLSLYSSWKVNKKPLYNQDN